MPTTTVMPASAAISAHAVSPSPVDRLGDRGQRNPEPAHGRFREHHERRAGFGRRPV